jgi:hypothetical protein
MSQEASTPSSLVPCRRSSFGSVAGRQPHQFARCQSALEWGSDSHPMKLSAELAVLQRGNQRHASRYSNFVACTEWVGYRERK